MGFWVGFVAFVLVMLALDLGVFHRKAHEVSMREAATWSVAWVTLAMVFNAGVLWLWGRDAALEFLTGYLIEKSLSTDIIPSTLSEVGGGVFGRIAIGRATLTYDAYVTNGLRDGVVGNALGRTDVASGKGEELFAEDNNGSPAWSGRVAVRLPTSGEVGVSYYGGYYNSFRLEGVEVDERRWLGIGALDFGGSVGPADVRGEIAYATVDVPGGMVEIFGDTQWGGHVDVTLPVWRPRLPGYAHAVLAASLRVESIDYNVGTFASTGASIRDDVAAIVPGISLRPTPGTVVRANYRYHWIRDFVGNPTQRMAGFQLGFATYF